MVTAWSLGPRFARFRQAAARTSSAVESGPPETARTSAGASINPAKKTSASASEIATMSSAVDTFLFPLNALFHVERRTRILEVNLAEGRAGKFLLTHRGNRLSEPK